MGGNADKCRTEDTLNINAVVLVETFILNRDKGVRQILRDLGHGNRYSVGIGRYQFCRLFSFDIVDKGGKAGR